MKNILTLAFFLAFCAGCITAPDNSQEQVEQSEVEGSTPNEISNNYPELLLKVLEAHGGLETWRSYTSLKYNMNSTLGGNKQESQFIDLNSRKVRLTGNGYVLGMDGEQVWVAPNKEAFGDMSARFYHNLIFYFYAIPHIFSDPGIQYEDMGTVTFADKEYLALKVTYNEGVGDADGDYYIAHFNPETYYMEWLLYTVTYFSGEKHENYNALNYPEWQNVGGLRVPSKFEGYKYADGVIGDKRYAAEFSEVEFSSDPVDQSIFEIPEEAEIDSLIVH